MKLFDIKTKLIPRNAAEKDSLIEAFNRNGIAYDVQEHVVSYITGEVNTIIRVSKPNGFRLPSTVIRVSSAGEQTDTKDRHAGMPVKLLDLAGISPPGRAESCRHVFRITQRRDFA